MTDSTVETQRLGAKLARGARVAWRPGLNAGVVAGLLLGLFVGIAAGPGAGFLCGLVVLVDVVLATIVLEAFEVRLVPEQVKATLPKPFAVLRAVDRFIQYHEVTVCLVALGVMIFLAFTQVILRQLNGSALANALPFVPAPVGWFDLVSRQLVVWVGLLGASLATSEGRHISIEALPKILSDRGKRRVDVLVNLVSSLVTGALLGICLIWLDRSQLPKTAELFVIEALELKVFGWPFLMVVPVGLGLMAWRFLTRAVEGIVLDDATYTTLRRLEEGEDPDGTHEEDGGSLRPESERTQIDEPGVARDDEGEGAQVHDDALQSDRFDDLSAQLAQVEALKKRAAGPPRAVFKSTDEIATYHPQDLHDDLDKADPVLQHGDEPSDELEISGVVDTGLEDVDGDVDDALDAAADSARRQGFEGEASETGEPLPAQPTVISLESSDEVDPVIPEGATERVPVQPPPEGDPTDDEDDA